jgi:hypothetical protein
LNTGDFFHDEPYHFGTETTYHFLIIMNNLSRADRSISSPQTRKLINKIVGNSYSAGVEFFRGTTEGILTQNKQFDYMETVGVRWGCYVAKYQIMQNGLIVSMFRESN